MIDGTNRNEKEEKEKEKKGGGERGRGRSMLAKEGKRKRCGPDVCRFKILCVWW